MRFLDPPDFLERLVTQGVSDGGDGVRDVESDRDGAISGAARGEEVREGERHDDGTRDWRRPRERLKRA